MILVDVALLCLLCLNISGLGKEMIFFHKWDNTVKMNQQSPLTSLLPPCSDFVTSPMIKRYELVQKKMQNKWDPKASILNILFQPQFKKKEKS